ncbi:hypothetical protein [Phenylobacterium sp.]|uniref:hypothetical protein n=1 Tax=Phenylobacterium sp. TaxID=1871053 RepID=UPI0025CCD54F|nr:hypothetical protein [Phenylobacterium sp.]
MASSAGVSGSRSANAAVAALVAALSFHAASASAGEMTRERFAAIMDSAFGRGAWRMTGGYRTPERENELRAQGAMTVRPGGLSRHSLGDADAPGAFDLVVDRMSPYEAAERLRSVGAPFARYQPKGTHGSQGPHLHLEPYGFGAPAAGGLQLALLSQPAAKAAKPAEEPRMRPVTLVMPALGAQGAAALRQELARLRAGAEQDRADAQLELGRAYAFGYLAPRDFAQARSWLLAAARNPSADPQTHDDAVTELAEVTDLLEAERAQQSPTRLGQLASGATGR